MFQQKNWGHRLPADRNRYQAGLGVYGADITPRWLHVAWAMAIWQWPEGKGRKAMATGPWPQGHGHMAMAMNDL